jgi:hypothetical protein
MKANYLIYVDPCLGGGLKERAAKLVSQGLSVFLADLTVRLKICLAAHQNQRNLPGVSSAHVGLCVTYLILALDLENVVVEAIDRVECLAHGNAVHAQEALAQAVVVVAHLY